LKAFFDQSGAYREGYDAIAVRAKGKGGKRYNDSIGKASNKSGSSRAPRSANPAKSRSSTRQPRATVETKAPLRASENRSRPVRNNNISKGTTGPKARADAQLAKKNAELETKVSELETTVCEIEKERDFYFGKLRSIELFLQMKQDQDWEGCERADVVENLFKVLYATVDDDVVVDDDGNIVSAFPPDSEANEEINAVGIETEM